MDRYFSTIRKPVKRQGGEHYLLITLLSFALSVSLTRLFLALTGYPQLGGGTLHIAHLLWGGLFLFIASLLPLIFANRWIYSVEAVLAGVGVGLFIDEVGKFITSNNNYFYPAAAPIIYAFFLITVLIYLRARRPPSWDARTELYVCLDSLEEVLDHDLDAKERIELETRLRYVAEKADHGDLARLANELLDFVTCQELYLAPITPTYISRAIARLRAFEATYFDRVRLRASLAGGLIGLGIVSFARLLNLVNASFSTFTLDRALSVMEAAGRLGSRGAEIWFYIRLVLEVIIGVFLISSSIMLAMGRERRAIATAYLILLVNLTTVDLLVFYYDQFSTIIPATLQFILLLGVLYYRQRYLRTERQIVFPSLPVTQPEDVCNRQP